MAKDKDEFDIEDEIEEEDDVLVPFDVATYPSDFTLSGIHEMWKNDDIEIPDFQRGFVWKIKQSSLLIDSFLLGLPVPPVFFYIDDEHKNLVIDGQQRIQSIVFFLDGYFGPENDQGRKQVFRLKGLDRRSPYSNKTFADLSDADQRRLKGAVLRAINVRQLSPPGKNTSIYHIFERLNTGGTALKPQEIRNCVFSGELVDVLKGLNDDRRWRDIIGRQKPDRHQRDVELILRLLALAGAWDKYERPMKEYLNITMKDNKRATGRNIARFRRGFINAISIVHKELGHRPFHLRGPLNTAVLDSVLGTIIAHHDKLRKDWKAGFEKLKKNPDFEATTTAATADVNSVKERFRLSEKFLLQ
jgi:hypothetical protein